MNLGFDIISDLNLTSESNFDWDGKATSLFCLVAGNISDDMAVLSKTLGLLSQCYQGVFFIEGSSEISFLSFKSQLQNEIMQICKQYKNVVYLHDNVVILEGIALVGVNGWYGTYDPDNTMTEIELMCAGYEDISYLLNTITKLQLHVDVKKIVVISSSVPSDSLYYGQIPKTYNNVMLSGCLEKDIEHKVSHWVFGSSEKIVDTVEKDVNYVNNSKFDRNPYYPKRIEVSY